jgi:hypothetical protein
MPANHPGAVHSKVSRWDDIKCIIPVWRNGLVFVYCYEGINSTVAMKRINMKITRIVIAFFITSFLLTQSEATESNPYRYHELTIYVIPSPVEFDWSSPATLYQTHKKSLIKTLTSSYSYSLGHLFVQLTSPLLDEPLYTGMRSTSRKEQQYLVLKEKVGLGILGIGVEGRLENSAELEEVIRFHAGKNKLAAITYRISDTAVRRILDFIDQFNSPDNEEHISSSHYGGTFWPLYEKEGAGCTAYGLAMLELAGIDRGELDQWKVEVNIPMELIGGELNSGRKVGLKDLRKTTRWHDGTGEANIDFVPFWIYDPTLIYNWIKTHVRSGNPGLQAPYTLATYPNVPRLFADFRDIGLSPDQPIFSRRSENNLFILHFFEQKGLRTERAEKE